MDMRHVRPFIDGMDAGRTEGIGGHLSDDVVLHSPLVRDPFVGRDAVVRVLGVLRAAVDEVVTTAVIAGEDRVAIALRIRAGGTEVTGVNDVSVGADGRIVRMSAQWRPLADVVAIQQRLAPLIGVPALELVEKRPV